MHKILTVLSWFFGITFALTGLGSLKHPSAAIICFLLTIVLIPPLFNLIQNKIFHKIIPRKYKIISVIVLLVTLGFVLPPTAPTKINSDQQNTTQLNQNRNFDQQAQATIPEPPSPSSQTKPDNSASLLPSTPTPAPKSTISNSIPTSTPSATTPQPTPIIPAPIISASPPPPTPQPNCDPNYSGCVPIASDVDCAGGSGNGPAYVKGPITVIGSDIYRLDSDHDGIACE